MCNNEAVANQVLVYLEQFCLDGSGVLDSEKAKAYIVACLSSAYPEASDED